MAFSAPKSTGKQPTLKASNKTKENMVSSPLYQATNLQKKTAIDPISCPKITEEVLDDADYAMPTGKQNTCEGPVSAAKTTSNESRHGEVFKRSDSASLLSIPSKAIGDNISDSSYITLDSVRDSSEDSTPRRESSRSSLSTKLLSTKVITPLLQARVDKLSEDQKEGTICVCKNYRPLKRITSSGQYVELCGNCWNVPLPREDNISIKYVKPEVNPEKNTQSLLHTDPLLKVETETPHDDAKLTFEPSLVPKKEKLLQGQDQNPKPAKNVIKIPLSQAIAQNTDISSATADHISRHSHSPEKKITKKKEGGKKYMDIGGKELTRPWIFSYYNRL